MKNSGASAVLLAFLALGAWAVPARAQADDRKKPNAFSGSPLQWGAEPIIDLYVRNMTRQYNLNADQEEYTRQLMTQRVKRFLNDYEKDVRSMVMEYWYYQSKGELPTEDVAQDWARRSKPLIAVIRKEIFDGNRQWRRILNEEQRRRHDQDLETMTRQFEQIEERVDRWERGIVEPSDIPGTAVGDVVKITKFEDAWEFRVNSFIQAYDLDAGQRETAYSVLRDVRQRAAQYREQNAADFARLEAEYKALRDAASTADEAARAKARAKRQELDKERTRVEHKIRVELWTELLERLERIPTADQKRMRREHLDRLQARAGIKEAAGSGTTKPSGTTRPAPTSQPAMTQPSVAATP